MIVVPWWTILSLRVRMPAGSGDGDGDGDGDQMCDDQYG